MINDENSIVMKIPIPSSLNFFGVISKGDWNIIKYIVKSQSRFQYQFYA